MSRIIGIACPIAVSVILKPCDGAPGTEFLMDMTPFHEFLTELFDKGKIVFRAAPRDRPSPSGRRGPGGGVRGPSASPWPVRASRSTPRSPARRPSSSGRRRWALVNRDDRMTDLVKRLKMPGSPLTPSHHLSADLTLRYLPQVLRRARGLDPSDPLVAQLANVLRTWPLSGVLSDVEEGPLVPLDFGGHPGLMLLYAERLVGNDRPCWRPITNGPSWDHYELVLQRARPEHARPSDGNEVHGG